MKKLENGNINACLKTVSYLQKLSKTFYQEESQDKKIM